MRNKLLYCAVHAVCGFLAWGVAIGWQTCYYPAQTQIPSSTVAALAGPAGLLIASAAQGLNDATDGRGFHFRLRPLNYEQRWQAFHELYPNLSRYYFDNGHDEHEDGCIAADVTGCK